MLIPMAIDGHTHLRTGEMTRAVMPYVARHCQAVVVMPNTANILTGADAARHRDEIIEIAMKAGFPHFRPLMTVMLTNDTDPADVENWLDAGVVAGKYYPADIYTHGGVSDLGKIDAVLREMGRAGIPLSGHFERAGVHPLDAEHAAIPDFRRLANRGDIGVNFEHVSTEEALEAIRDYPHAVGTITPHHLWMTADDVYDSSRENIRNAHNWCRPVAKTPGDREALRIAAMSGNPRIFYGSDFAPHPYSAKMGTEPPAGCACYPAAIPVLAEVFAQYGRLDQLANFTSVHAARFYGIQLDDSLPLLTVDDVWWRVPGRIPIGPQGYEYVVPWLSGTIL